MNTWTRWLLLGALLVASMALGACETDGGGEADAGAISDTAPDTATASDTASGSDTPTDTDTATDTDSATDTDAATDTAPASDAVSATDTDTAAAEDTATDTAAAEDTATDSDATTDTGPETSVDCASGLEDGTPCDDGVACTEEDVCEAGVCVGTVRHALCDDDDACTLDSCHIPSGGCLHLGQSGLRCEGAEACEIGRCVEGACVLATEPCDDGRICTAGSCVGAECAFEGLSPVGQLAPAFALTDANPHSPTYEQQIDTASLLGKVVVLVFHPASCGTCYDDAEAARPFHTTMAARNDVEVLALNGIGQESLVQGYVEYDADGEPPLLTTWPYLQDVAAAELFHRYCATNKQVVVVNPAGTIVFYQVGDFTNGEFVTSLTAAIDAAAPSPRSMTEIR